mmetsp:Transcript_11294/g.25303  ORF Transcript_11294/g.25303 Transcript_11294/m.25303 type:complete len:280 (-) Transcript_11294:160-999(-)
MDPQFLSTQLAALENESVARVIAETLRRRPELAPSVVSKAVPDLTYAPADALSKRRSVGVIKSWSPNGFGFISCPELREVFGNDAYVHRNQIGQFQQGQEVSFAVLLSKDLKPQAFDLQPSTGMSGMPGMSGMGKGQGVVVPPGGCWGGGKGWAGDGGWGKGGCMWGKGFEKGFDKGGKGKTKTLSEHAKPDVQQVLGKYMGIIKSFNARNGFGFIECEALRMQGFQNDVYLHHSQIGTLQPGAEVTFTAYLNKKGQPQAMELMPLGAESTEAVMPIGA